MTFKLASELLSQVKKEHREAAIKFKNGVDYFILPLARLTVNFCDVLQDSNGVRDTLLSDDFSAFVRLHPSVEFIIEPMRGHRPVFRAYYLHSGPPPPGQTRRERVVCLRNLDQPTIMGILQELRNDSGQSRRRFKPTVHSDTPAARPIWSPFHDNVEANNPLHALKQMVAEKKAAEEASIARSLAKLPRNDVGAEQTK